MPTGPDPKSLISEDSFLDYVSEGQTYSTAGGVRSTASINGTQQYAATTHSISDILQGNLYQTNPQDQLLVINKALTDSLNNIYQSGGDAYAYSSFSQAVPSGALGGGGGANQGQGTQLNESWVNSLPLTHPTTNAVIWKGEGKASREMHLPTSEDINVDVENQTQGPYKQVEMPDDWKHPYNMDRKVGDGAGGNKPHIGSDGYVHDWGGGENIINSNHPKETIGNENPQAPGTTGAFGYLDPESEKWYMAMAWPYKGMTATDGPVRSFNKAGRSDIAAKALALRQSDYKGKKLLVFHPASSRGVVCTPGDWGSQPYWSNGAESFGSGSIVGFYYGLSPDVHATLGTDHGETFKVRWMPDDTPLGPYSAKNATEGTVGGAGFAGGAGDGSAASFLAMALTQKGKPYVYNTGENSSIADPPSFDCSGLVKWAAERSGYQADPKYGDWSFTGTQIKMMQEGNSLFPTVEQGYETPGALLVRAPRADGSNGHVAISVGDGTCMEAASPEKGVNVFNGVRSTWTHAGFLPGMS